MPAQQTTKRWRVLSDGSKVRHVYISTPSSIRTHAEADARAAELGLEFPGGVKTVAQKVQHLASR